VGVVRDEVGKAAAKAKAKLAALNLNDRADALRGDIRDQAIEKILEDHTLGEIIDAIRDLTPAQREEIRQKVGSSRELIAANKALAQAVIQERVAAAVATARKKAQQAVARAKKQLAKAIESAIRDAVPEQVAGSKSWVDPFVGFRGRLLLTDRVYLSARADIGGFGVASDLTWNAVGAIGCQLNKNWSAEIGWRYLVIDYSNGGFVYDTETSGLFMGLTRRL
jgi:hypothetical protein